MNRITDPGYIPERIVANMTNKHLAEIYKKLCEYENYGLTPEQLREMDKLYREKREEVADLKEQLKKYEEIKIGDKVYEPDFLRNYVSTYKITAFTIFEDSCNVTWELIDGVYSNLVGFNTYAIGKSVFFTREEAEQALKERGSHGDFILNEATVE